MIKVKDETIEEIAATLPNLAHDLAIRGVKAVMTIESDRAVARLYLYKDGDSFQFVAGSRALYNRYMAIISDDK